MTVEKTPKHSIGKRPTIPKHVAHKRSVSRKNDAKISRGNTGPAGQFGGAAGL